MDNKKTRATAKTAKRKEKIGPFKPNNIAIMYRPGTTEAIKQAKKLATWLVEMGYTVYSTPGQTLTTACKQATPQAIKKLDWVIVLGGDGTYLAAVRMLHGRQVPILGVNMGSLGFLTETRLEDLFQAVSFTLENKMEFRPRAMLNVKVRRNNKVRAEYIALNDVVLERGASTHLINVTAYSQNHLVGEIKADALIIASPTGSTAYNLAAGGPILHPEARVFVVTPASPHSLTSRPLIFPDDQDLSFRIQPKNRPVVLTIDGVNCDKITSEDEVTVVRNAQDHYVIRHPAHNFYDLLREKLKFGQRN